MSANPIRWLTVADQMYCSKCGTLNTDSSQFCSACGQTFSGAPSPAPLPTATGTPGPPAFPETSGKAIASLVCGLLSLIFPAAIAAIVLGHISRSEIRKSGGRLQGEGMALVGLILGYLGISLIPILIVAAIVIPNLLRARIAANESSAVGAIRTLNSAEASYANTYSKVGRTCNLRDLAGAGGSPTAAGLIDDSLASGELHGYVFHLDGCAERVFLVTAVPRVRNQTGVRTFCSNEDGVVRASIGSAEDCAEDGQPL